MCACRLSSTPQLGPGESQAEPRGSDVLHRVRPKQLCSWFIITKACCLLLLEVSFTVASVQIPGESLSMCSHVFSLMEAFISNFSQSLKPNSPHLCPLYLSEPPEIRRSPRHPGSPVFRHLPGMLNLQGQWESF